MYLIYILFLFCSLIYDLTYQALNPDVQCHNCVNIQQPRQSLRNKILPCPVAVALYFLKDSRNLLPLRIPLLSINVSEKKNIIINDSVHYIVKSTI